MLSGFYLDIISCHPLNVEEILKNQYKPEMLTVALNLTWKRYTFPHKYDELIFEFYQFFVSSCIFKDPAWQNNTLQYIY